MTNDKAKLSVFRLLVLTPIQTVNLTNPLVKCLEAITGTKPVEELASFAGYTSHTPLRLRTKYYKSDVSIWCDELPLPTQKGATSNNTSKSTQPKKVDTMEEALSLEHWQSQMLSSEAEEVRSAIGGILLVLPVDQQTNSSVLESFVPLVEVVNQLREVIEDESSGREIAAVILLQNTTANGSRPINLDDLVKRIEDVCLTGRGIFGWDFVTWDGSVDMGDEGNSRNEFGEKKGIARIIEVLEGVDWNAPLPGAEGGDLEDMADDKVNVLGMSRYDSLGSDLQTEMMGLKLSMLEQQDQIDELDDRQEEGEDLSMEQMQALIDKVTRIREVGADMPQDERERFAKKEVGKIMKELG